MALLLAAEIAARPIHEQSRKQVSKSSFAIVRNATSAAAVLRKKLRSGAEKLGNPKHFSDFARRFGARNRNVH
jgi:hypothetical protein